MFDSDFFMDSWFGEKPNNKNLNIEKIPAIAPIIDSLSKDESHYLNKVYKYLLVIGLVKNKSDFCEKYLGRSKDYLSMVESSGRMPSVSALHQLLVHLEEKAGEYELNASHQGQYQILQKLIKEGQQFIANRLLKEFY